MQGSHHVISMTFCWSNATEVAVCLSTSDGGLFVDGIRGTLRMLFANWASAKWLANAVSRGCTGGLIEDDQGIASFTSCLFFNRTDSSTWNLTSACNHIFCVRRLGVAPQTMHSFGGIWIRGLGLSLLLGCGPKNWTRDQSEGIPLCPRWGSEDAWSEDACTTPCQTAVRIGSWNEEPAVQSQWPVCPQKPPFTGEVQPWTATCG